MGREVYKKLIDKLNEFPLGVNMSDKAVELLQSLFSEEEARLALDLPTVPTDLKEIVKTTGRDEAQLLPILETMADKGLVYAGKVKETRLYSLWPMVPGIFELQFMKKDASPIKQKQARLFDEAFSSGWADELFSSPTPFARVIPVDKDIPAEMNVLPYEQAKNFIEQASYIALSRCDCRSHATLLGRACKAPLDVCLTFGPFAQYAVERGFGRKITREEALEALQKSEDSNLVHVCDNSSERINFICNCCGCCCLLMQGVNRMQKPNAVAKGRLTAQVKTDDCLGCEACIPACQVSAISLAGDKAVVDESRCIGCALCISACPAEALTMAARSKPVPGPLRNFKEVSAAIMKEKGRV